MCHVGAYCGRYTIVVDDDIDVSDLNAVMWALLTRSDPATSIEIIRGAWSTPLDPRIEPERRAVGDFTNSRAVIDACRPFHWKDKFPEVNAPTPGGKGAGSAQIRASVPDLSEMVGQPVSLTGLAVAVPASPEASRRERLN